MVKQPLRGQTRSGTVDVKTTTLIHQMGSGTDQWRMGDGKGRIQQGCSHIEWRERLRGQTERVDETFETEMGGGRD